MTDFAMQRLNMVESQLRPSDISDRRILRAMGEIPRELFLPTHLRAIAYMDNEIRLGGSGRGAVRTLLAPRTLAQLVQLARIEDGERVLVIGGGTGYEAAVIGRLAADVIAIESDAELGRMAAATLSAAEIRNVRVVSGELRQGLPAEAPYDVVFVNGAIAVAPAGVLDQLKDAGRMVAVVAHGGVGRGTIWRRNGMHFDERAMFEAEGTMLPGFAVHPAFTL